MDKILFTTVTRPFGVDGEGDSVGAELFHAQITKAQGMFSPRQIIRCWALDYIAENINRPSVVLHYPSMDEFEKEIKKTSYPLIGINFVLATFHKIQKMAALIRKYSPRSKIVLGGYGTILSDEELEPFSDYICRKEGIYFMRELLGEDPEAPIEHPYVPIDSPSVLSYAYPSKVMHVTSGLGCPNGCEFCCTSHFFKRNYLPMVKDGADLHRVMSLQRKRAEEKGHEYGGFFIIDEDFFINRKKAGAFLERVREEQDDFAIMGFGSVRGLSNFTADEIAEMGMDLLWIGFESEKSDFGKLKGRPIEKLIADLKDRGVAVLTSMIIGVPGQTRESIMRDFKRLLSVGPTFSQFLIYFAFPGTPLHKRVLEEDLYLDEYKKDPDYRKFDGFALHFKNPEFTPAEMKGLQDELYREEYNALGPSVIRIAEVWLRGYRNLVNSDNSLLRKRAARKLENLKGFLPVVYAGTLFGPNKKRRDDAGKLYSEIIEVTGQATIGQKLFNLATIPLALWTKIKELMKMRFEPSLERIEYKGMKKQQGQGIPEMIADYAAGAAMTSSLGTNSSSD